MKRHQTQRLITTLLPGLSILILIGVTTNTVTTLKLTSELKRVPPCSLRCAAVPTRLILEDPACAQKLLAAMNVTNVRISALPTGLPEETNATDEYGPRGSDARR